jgi:hypothetical protein
MISRGLRRLFARTADLLTCSELLSIFGRDKDILGSFRNIDGQMRADRFGDRQKGGTPMKYRHH